MFLSVWKILLTEKSKKNEKFAKRVIGMNLATMKNLLWYETWFRRYSNYYCIFLIYNIWLKESHFKLKSGTCIPVTNIITLMKIKFHNVFSKFCFLLESTIWKRDYYIKPPIPNSGREKINLSFYFHFFLVPQKVLLNVLIICVGGGR